MPQASLTSYLRNCFGRVVSERIFHAFRGDQWLIEKSRLFDSNFVCGPNISVAHPIQWYKDMWKSGAVTRKPMPGFHPGIYAENISVDGVEPFVHFLKSQRPLGPWLKQVIDPSSENNYSTDLKRVGKTALHIHLHYYDQTDDILDILSHLQIRPDLKISVTSEAGKKHVLEALKKSCDWRADVRLIQNRGRDIGPFLTEFASDLMQYEVIGHIHSKRSSLFKDRKIIDQWINFLWENILGGRFKMGDLILDHFARDPSLGLVFPDDPHIVGWTINKDIAESLAARMQIKTPLPSQIDFPVGNMFWARTQALAPIFNLNLRWEDYPDEPVGYDGTMLHAIERLIPLIVASAGYKCAVTHVPQVSR